MRGKALAHERNESARAFTKAIVDQKFEGNVSRAATAFGISQAMLYEFLAGKRGAGMKILTGIANHEHVSVDQIIGLTPPAPRPERVTERTEKPTELVELLAEERKNGREWPQGVIDAALSLRHLQGERLSHADWRTFLNEVELTGRRPLKVPAHQVPVPTEEEAAAAQAARIEAVLKRRRENQE